MGTSSPCWFKIVSAGWRGYISAAKRNLLFLLTIIPRRIIIYIIFSILIFIDLFRGGLTGVFQIIVPLRIPTALELHNMNRWANTFPRYFLLGREFIVPSLTASNSGPEAAKQLQTNRLPPPRLMGGMMISFMIQTFLKGQLLSHQSFFFLQMW